MGACLPCLPPRKKQSFVSTHAAGGSRVQSGYVAIHATNFRVVKKLPSALGPSLPEIAQQNKIIYLVRHAEALHNVQEKCAQDECRQAGGQDSEVEAARKRALEDEAFLDASLSPGGQKQVCSAAKDFTNLLERTHYPLPEIVFVSPLQRTLETASLLFPGHRNMIAMEFLREKRTGLPCDERKQAAEIEEEFPHINFSDIERADAEGSDAYVFREGLQEDNKAVRERGSALLDFLRFQSSEVIAVVTHKGLLRELSRGPLAKALDPQGGMLPAVFGNAEVRVCEVAWGSSGNVSVKARSLADAMVQPPMAVSDLHPADAGGDSTHAISCRSMRNLIFPAKDSGETSVPESGGVQMAVGSSDADDDAEASLAAWRQMQEHLGGAPTFALVFGHGSVEGDAVAAALEAPAGACCVLGSSSLRGVLTPGGPSRMGILGFRGLAWRCGIGARGGANGPRARQAGYEAAMEATEGHAPDLIFLCAEPGCEEEVLEGIHDACGSVAIFGGSSTSTYIAGGRISEHCWQLHGSMAGWGVHSDTVVVAALWLFSNANVSCLLSHCFAPTQRKGRITKAHGRVLSEIDRLPAAKVLNEWMGGILNGKAIGDSVTLEAAQFPLAMVQGGTLRLVHAKAITEGGQMKCFRQVACGDVRLLKLKASDIVAALAAVARSALERAPFKARGGIVCLPAGTTAALSSLHILAAALPKELPELFCFFSFGQLGMVDGASCHGNLMVNIMLIG